MCNAAQSAVEAVMLEVCPRVDLILRLATSYPNEERRLTAV